jgi:hypothetical protein
MVCNTKALLPQPISKKFTVLNGLSIHKDDRHRSLIYRMEIDANVAVTIAERGREESDSDAEPQPLKAAKGQTE